MMKFAPINMAVSWTEPMPVLFAQIPVLPSDGATIRTINLVNKLCVFEWGDFARFEEWDFALNLKHKMPIGGTHGMVWCQTKPLVIRRIWSEASQVEKLVGNSMNPYAIKIDILAYWIRHFLPGVSMIPNGQYFIPRRHDFEEQAHHNQSESVG